MTINAVVPPGWSLRYVAEREQPGGAWVVNRYHVPPPGVPMKPEKLRMAACRSQGRAEALAADLRKRSRA